MAINWLTLIFTTTFLLGASSVRAQLDHARSSKAQKVLTQPSAEMNNVTLDLVDVSARTGINFVHSAGGSGKRYIVETVVAGLAVFDYDADGWLDIYFLNGVPLPGTENAVPAGNALYRNNGDWTFTDVTLAAGVAGNAYGMGVVAADYDQDGDDDLYLANFGKNILYANNGDGTFAQVTGHAGVDRGDGFGTGAVWLDIEGDGDLDLYSGSYVNFQFEQHVPRVIGGREFHAGPAAYPPALHDLFLNNGNGTFTNISQSSGIGRVPGPGMGAIAFDSDQDNDMDLFVCNDGQPNFLFVNDGQGHFEEQAFAAGLAVDRSGVPNGNMGVEVADVDGDGLLDLLTTDYQDELPVLYRNQGDGLFEDVSLRARIDQRLLPHVKWGVGLIDIDNDADRDAFVACGHFLDNLRFIDDRTDVKVANFLLLNDGHGRFSNVSQRCGSGLQVIESTRGAAFDDFDNDGDTDMALLNANAPPTILRNDSALSGHWLDVRLIGRMSNRSAAGALVTLTSGDRTQVQALHCGRGYQSHYATQLHFGLGSATQIQKLAINWPSGKLQIIHPAEVDRCMTILESD